MPIGCFVSKGGKQGTIQQRLMPAYALNTATAQKATTPKCPPLSIPLPSPHPPCQPLDNAEASVRSTNTQIANNTMQLWPPRQAVANAPVYPSPSPGHRCLVGRTQEDGGII